MQGYKHGPASLSHLRQILASQTAWDGDYILAADLNRNFLQEYFLTMHFKRLTSMDV